MTFPLRLLRQSEYEEMQETIEDLVRELRYEMKRQRWQQQENHETQPKCGN